MLVILLIWLLPLQVYAGGDIHLGGDATTTIEHLLVHAKHVPHHHEGDGRIHFDMSHSSSAHDLDFDSAVHFFGLLADWPEAVRHREYSPAPLYHPRYITHITDGPPVPPPRLPA